MEVLLLEQVSAMHNQTVVQLLELVLETLNLQVVLQILLMEMVLAMQWQD